MEPIAYVRSYDDLIAVLRARQAELKLTNEGVERAAGFSDGHWDKIVGPSRIKHFGPMSFDTALETLGIALEVRKIAPRIRDDEQRRIRPVTVSNRLSVAAARRLFPGMFARLGRKGGKARMQKMSGKERSRIAAIGGRNSWKRERERKRAAREAKGRNIVTPL